jgi:hypothetical protein
MKILACNSRYPPPSLQNHVIDAISDRRRPPCGHGSSNRTPSPLLLHEESGHPVLDDIDNTEPS